MTFIPMIIVIVAIFLFGQMQLQSIEQHYELEDVDYVTVSNPVYLYEHFIQKVKEQIHTSVQKQDGLMEDEEYLTSLNEQLAKKCSYLIVQREEEIIFIGNDENLELLQKGVLKKSQSSDNSSVYMIEGIGFLIRHIGFEYENGDAGHVFIVAQMSEILPQVKNFICELIITLVVVCVLTAIVLSLWIQRSVVVPLRKLREATTQIADGDLNFTIKAEADDEFGMLCRDFEEMRMRLKENAQEKLENDAKSKELISNISHDLKTPITAIIGYVEGIMDGVADTPDKMNRYIQTIYHKAKDMDQLIGELTLYSQIDTNKIPYNFDKVNIDHYFQDCVEELKIELEARHIQLHYVNELEPGVMVIADVEQMKRVINNIISNSVKYIGKKEGIVNICIHDEGDFIHIEMEDNGCGIPAKELPLIFERFYRTDMSRNSSKGGSGIGLSIAKKIVEAHSGSIWATGKEGVGTTIHIVLRKFHSGEQEETMEK